MTLSLRQYRRTHEASPQPLVALHEYVQAHGRPGAADVAELAARLKLPPAAVRAAASYYADLHQKPGELRICHGTSCVLACANHNGLAAHSTQPTKAVYCLGYCDRSPAVLRADDQIVVECDDPKLASADSQPPPGPPAIRCVADQPIVTRNVIDGDFGELSAARERGVYEALESVLRTDAHAIIRKMIESGERGRGGAGYPTGLKWRQCAEANGEHKYIIANGDEGDPGSFIDRILMELDPHSILEGMIIGARAIGATHGIVFVRSEYPQALRRMQRAVEQAQQAGILGDSVMGSDLRFNVSVFAGMGSYVCGEETAMLNAIEGFRGEVRLRPPYPAESGLYGMPTVVNNVETLLNVPWIMKHGPGAFAAQGTSECSGTKAMCFNNGFAKPCIVEVVFGRSLKQLIEQEAGGGREGRQIAAVLLGGPMGSVLEPREWDVPVCYAAMGKRGIQLGHGGVVAVPADANFASLLNHLLGFMQDESCGKCVPCRVGSQRALEMASAIGAEADVDVLRQLLDVIAETSLCAFGQLIPRSARQLIDKFAQRIIEDGAARERI